MNGIAAGVEIGDSELEALIKQNSGFRRRTTLKIALSILLSALFVFSVMWRDGGFDEVFKPIDDRAEKYLEDTLTNAAITYGAIRGIHAVIAIFKGTQVHPPFVTLSVGEALDPVQDLIERFSDALTLAIASLGAQRFLMEIAQLIGVWVFAGAGAALLLVGLWIERPLSEAFTLWGSRLIVFGFAARLIIPLMAFSADMVSARLLESHYARVNAQIEFDKQAIANTTMPSDEDQGFFDKLKSWTSIDAFKQKIEDFKQKCENLAISLVSLFSLFVFQTLIFPLVSFWIFLRVFSGFFPRKLL